jgi:hypothetical protein
MGPLSGPEIWQIPKFGLQKIGGFTDDDARLTDAVSRAVFGPTDSVGSASGLERTTDLRQTSHEVRKVPKPEGTLGSYLGVTPPKPMIAGSSTKQT